MWWRGQGRTAVRPYVTNHHDTVDMIRHHYEGVQFDLVTDMFRAQPFRHNDLAGDAEACLATNHVPERALAVLRAYRHKIRARLRVIVFAQAD
jgi:hypothetical protein